MSKEQLGLSNQLSHEIIALKDKYSKLGMIDFSIGNVFQYWGLLWLIRGEVDYATPELVKKELDKRFEPARKSLSDLVQEVEQNRANRKNRITAKSVKLPADWGKINGKRF